MRQVHKTLGIIAIAAVMGIFSFSCDSGNSGNSDLCKNGHAFPNWTDPTCTVAGNSERTCINCTQKETRTTGYAALGHQWDDENGIVTEPTCTEEGGTKRTCTREGCIEYEIIGEPVSALGHQGLTPAFAATCIVAGNSEESGTCTRAGCIEVIITGRIINALGHQGLTPAFATTCMVAGNSEESGTCTRAGCGEVITGTVINALGHDFDWEMAGIKTCNRCHANPAIGDTGPAGGIIFYIDPTGFTVQGYSEGIGVTADLNFAEYIAHYLEAAPTNMAMTLGWAIDSADLIPGLSQSDDDDTDWAIGRGRINTAIIIARGINHTTPAASTWAALAIGEKADWFLPSLDELNQFYLKFADSVITSVHFFWASSQGGIYGAWVQNFIDGSQLTANKASVPAVRAVRAF